MATDRSALLEEARFEAEKARQIILSSLASPRKVKKSVVEQAEVDYDFWTGRAAMYENPVRWAK